MFKKLCIFPYDQESKPILKYSHLLNNYKITTLVTPSGWSNPNIEKDVQIEVKNTLTKDSINYDVILVPNTPRLKYCEDIILDQLLDIVQYVSAILIDYNFTSKKFEQLQSKCYKNKFNKLLGENETSKISKLLVEKSIVNIEVPIMIILGMWEDTSKFALSLALRDKFLVEGYKITQIGSRSYSHFFGFHNFPQFMLEHEYSEAQKVLLFNHYLAKLAKEENPDLIIITVPGGIFRYSNEIIGDFGILMYLLSQAITVDYAIMSIFFQSELNDMLSNINTLCTFRYGFPIDYWNVSDRYINSEKTIESSDLDIQTIDHNTLHRKLLEWHYLKNIGTIIKKEEIDKIFDNVIQKLTKTDMFEII